MNNKIKALIVALGLSVPSIIIAQDAPAEGARPEHRRPRPPVPAVITALDINKDGVIDANEIANAAQLLMSLDKNADGSLTPDEFIGARGPRPEAAADQADKPERPQHPRGPRGPRGPRPDTAN